MTGLTTLEKPVMIGEMSRDEPDPDTSENGKSAWITDAFNKIKGGNYPKIKLFVWFDHNKYEDPKMRYWKIGNWESCRLSFKTAVADPYYLSTIQ